MYGRWNDNGRTGYGIDISYNGDKYRGEFRLDDNDNEFFSYSGWGHMKYQNNDEFDGYWHNGFKNGEGIFKEASTGRIERRRYYNDVVIEVLEVIEQGQ